MKKCDNPQMSAKRLEAAVFKIIEDQLTKPEVILNNLEYDTDDAQAKQQ